MLPIINHVFTDKERALLHSKGFVKIEGNGDCWLHNGIIRFDDTTQVSESCDAIICVLLKKGKKIFKLSRYTTKDTKDCHSCHKSVTVGKAKKTLQRFLDRHHRS